MTRFATLSEIRPARAGHNQKEKTMIIKNTIKSPLKVGQTVSYDFEPGVYRITAKYKPSSLLGGGIWRYDIEAEGKVIRGVRDKALNAETSRFFAAFATA